MRVELLHHTPLWVTSTAIRKCWASESLSDTKFFMDYVDEDQVSMQDPAQRGEHTSFAMGEKDLALIDRVGNKNKHACYDQETEVLTDEGWKKFYDLSASDKVCTLNPDTKVVEYHVPTRHFKYEVDEELVHYAGRGIDLMVTKNHKVYATINDAKSNRNPKTREFGLVTAEDTLTRRHLHTKRSNGTQGTSYPAALMKLLGFFIGDGTQHTNVLSYHLRKTRKIQYLQEIVQELPGFSFYSTRQDYYSVSIPTQYRELFNQCLIEKEKVIPNSILFGASKQSLEALLDGYANADGTHALYQQGIIEVATTSTRLVEQLQTLAVHTGRGFQITYVATATKPVVWPDGKATEVQNQKDCYTLRLPSNKLDLRFNNSDDEATPALVHYTGSVYCVEVENHIIMTRRSGKHIWSGNSTLEHVTYNFDIRGVSRALLQELARHRISSFSVKSSRYTLKELRDFEDLTFDSASQFLVYGPNEDVNQASYASLQAVQQLLQQGFSNDIVKYALPEAYKTSLVWSVNARSLQNFLALRTSKAALKEIQDLAYAIYIALPEDHTYLFEEIIDGS